MPIIVGAPRSGTTLLRLILDAHPRLAIPPETGFLSLGSQFKGPPDSLRYAFFEAIISFPPDAPAWSDFGIEKDIFWAKLREIDPFTVSAGYRAFYQLYASRFGKDRWGDKTPAHSFSMKAIDDVLPEAHFLHIVRDGRDVCLSLRQTWFSPGWDVETQARQWCSFVTTAREQGAQCRHYMEIKYEDMVLTPRQVVQSVCAFLDLGYTEVMLEYYLRAASRLQEQEARLKIDGSVVVTKEQRFHQQHKTTQPLDVNRVLAWKRAMSIEDRQQFETLAGHLLKALGYETEAQ